METSDRIIERMKHLKLKGVDLQSALKVSSGTVSQWRSGLTRPAGENLINLSKLLNRTPEWIITGLPKGINNDDHNNPGSQLAVKLPLLKENQVNDFLNRESSEITVQTWHTLVIEHSRNMFSMLVENPNIGASAPAGAIATIEYGTPEKNDDVVLISLGPNQHPTLKKIVIDGPHVYLKSLDSGLRTIEKEEEHTIYGVAKRIEINL